MVLITLYFCSTVYWWNRTLLLKKIVIKYPIRAGSTIWIYRFSPPIIFSAIIIVLSKYRLSPIFFLAVIVYWLLLFVIDLSVIAIRFAVIVPTTALREISGSYWLIYVSLAIVFRLTRIIRSIDPTVENFQVNDPDLWESQFNERKIC